nr:hypothetical protein [Tanacetum cinerariifolium]
MFDCDEMFSSETNESFPASPIYDRYQLGEGYHAVPHPHTGIFMPPKPDLVFHDASIVNETAHTAFKVELSPTKPDKDLSHTHRPSAPIIKDWVFDSKDDSEAEITQIAPSLVQPIEQVKPLRPSVKPVENSILAANHKTSILKPKSHRNSRNACFVLLTRPSAPILEDWVFDLEDDSEAELPQNALSFVQPTEQVKTPRPSVKPVENSISAANHMTTIPKPKSHGNNRNKKACFVCKSLTYLIKDCDYYEKKMAQTPAKNHAQRGNHQQYAKMTLPNPQSHVVPTTVLTKTKLVPLTAARQVNTTVSPNNVTRPRPAKTVVTKPHSSHRRNINHRPSPKASTFPPKVTAAEAPMVNAVKGVQGNLV